MTRINFGPSRSRTQGLGNIILFPQREPDEPPVLRRLRDLNMQAKSLKDLRALGVIWFEAVRAFVGPNAVWIEDARNDPLMPEGWKGPRLLKAPTIPIHPAAMLMPPLDKDGAETLMASIKRYGLQKEIKLYADGSILDGRHRYYACLATGVEPRFEEWSESDDMTPEAYVAIHNVHRRQLTLGQMAMFATDMVNTEQGGDRKSEAFQKIKVPFGTLIDGPAIKGSFGTLIDGPVTQTAAAQFWGISLRAVKRAAFIRNNADDTPTVVADLRAGRMTLGRAHMLAEMDKERRREEPEVKFAGQTPKPRSKPSLDAIEQVVMKLDDQQWEELLYNDILRGRVERALQRLAKKWRPRLVSDNVGKPAPDDVK